MFFASLFAMVVSGVILIIIFIAAISSMISKATNKEVTNTVDKGSVLYLDLGKRMHEQGEENSLAAFNNGDAFSAGVYEVTKALEKAKTDDNIKGILLRVDDNANGWATSQQIKEALSSFHKSGKFIYAYGEQIPQRSYYIAAVADSIYLNPVGAAELKGLATSLAFFKGTLDKLGLQPEIFYCGKFKSATEPFRADKMSEPNRLQIATLQNSIWREFLTGAAKHAGTDTATINNLATTGAILFPEDALKNKLVDGLLYFDEVEQRIRAKTDQKATDKVKYMDIDKYAANLRSGGALKEDRVAVIFAEGEISDGEKGDDYQIASETFCKTIRDVRNNDKIKAVVLRVNSPGGSALASEVILRELQLLKQKKTLIVSMGDVAASGGYYIACQADSIFAMPTTITGSIGVFGMMFNIGGLMKDKLGVTFDVQKNAPYADFPTATRALTADEGQRVQRGVDTIYSIFKRRVAVGRRMTVDNVDSIAQGRVWTGSDALKLGLVDGLGNMDRAIKSAVAKAGISDYKIVTYPERVDKLESLIRKIKGGGAMESSIKADLQKELGTDYDLYMQIKSLRKMNGKMMMAMPFRMEVK